MLLVVRGLVGGLVVVFLEATPVAAEVDWLVDLVLVWLKGRGRRLKAGGGGITG